MTYQEPIREPAGRSLRMAATPATPPLLWQDTDRQHGVCVCGKAIITGCFGWVHKKNLWVSLDFCEEARPHVEDHEERPL